LEARKGEFVVKTTILILAASFAAACGVTGMANAQSKQGYAVDTSSTVWRNYQNECWRAGYWTPAMAIQECDPVVAPPKPAVTPPTPAQPAPKPEAKPAPGAPKPVALRTTVYFASNDATLDADDRAKLDSDIIGKLGTVGAISYVNVNGHTDRMGSAQYNQKLSEKRAAVVKAYLVSKGMDASKIEVYGFGKTTPIPTLKCPDQKDRKALIACLQPNRRTEVELQGAPR
jgi:OOP family OmpA-OmpF porin